MGKNEKVKILTSKQKGQNRHWKNFLDKNYLGSHNLEPGEEMLLTIERFEGEEEVKTNEGDKIKQVLYFKENVPKMIINITNGTTIASLYGSHPEQWIGKKIQVYATSVKAFGKTQDALRIRDFIPEHDVDTAAYIQKLDEAKTLSELATTWKAFPASARDNKEVFNHKEALKEKLS